MLGPHAPSASKARQAAEKVIAPSGPFPVAAQRALNIEVMTLLGFDFAGGRLDESTHPFSGGVPEDVRLTTRYSEDDFSRSLLGTIHETGHGRYEQNLPRDLLGQPVAEARSMALHESQSLLMEMQACRSDAFLSFLGPQLQRSFGGDAAAYAPENLGKLWRRVGRGFIRVDADELTYPAHVILRFRLERAMIRGDLAIADLPGNYLNWFAREGFPPGEIGRLLALMHEIDHNGLSALLDPLRAKWREGSLAVADIEAWQQALWRFTNIGHLGKVGGPKSWLEPVTPLAAQAQASGQTGREPRGHDAQQ